MRVHARSNRSQASEGLGCNSVSSTAQMACELRAQLSGQLTQEFLLRWSLSPLVGYNGPA